jgi:hypothetical protein
MTHFISALWRIRRGHSTVSGLSSALKRIDIPRWEGQSSGNVSPREIREARSTASRLCLLPLTSKQRYLPSGMRPFQSHSIFRTWTVFANRIPNSPSGIEVGSASGWVGSSLWFSS